MSDYWDKITEREVAIIILVAEGYTDEEVAERLDPPMKPGGVRIAVQRLFRRTSTRNRANLVAWAIRREVIE